MNVASIIPQWPGVEIDDFESDALQITIYAHSSAQVAYCPVCKQPSTAIHSGYDRHPSDISAWRKKVRWVVGVRHFFCRNNECKRKVFCERLTPRLRVYARRTSDLTVALEAVSSSTSAKVGAGLIDKLGLSASSSTLLRIVRRIQIPTYAAPQVLGVDDWAFRRGHRYGTILCDLERHCVIDLLPERSAESLATWLQAHPGIAIICRDRSDVYASGIAQGAPDALQVLDRWHLLKNVGEAVDVVLRSYRRFLLKSTSVVDSNATVALANLSGKSSPKDKKRHRNEAKRQARYDRVHQLYNEGFDSSAIAQTLGISVRLTKKLLAAPSCPFRRRPPVKDSILEPFLAELTRRFKAGCHNSMQLWHELVKLGFPGSYTTVHKVVCRLQQGLPAQWSSSSALIPQKQCYTVRQAKWLFTAQPDNLPIADAAALASILEQADLAHLYQLAQDFSGMIRLRLVDQLDTWLATAKVSRFPAFMGKRIRVVQDDASEKCIISRIAFAFSHPISVTSTTFPH